MTPIVHAAITRMSIAALLLAIAGCAAAPPSSASITRAPEAPVPAAIDAARPDPAADEASPAARIVSGPEPVPVSERLWHFAGSNGRVIETPNYRIHTTLQSRPMLGELPKFYEGCLHHYRTALADLPRPSRPMETFIFRTDEQWREKTREVLPEQADAFMSLGRGGFTTRGTAVLFYIGARDTLAIAAHEGWHQYTQSTFRQPLPIWLEEGLATYMESIFIDQDEAPRLRAWDNGERHYALQRAVYRNRVIPLTDLLASSPQAFLEDGKRQLLVYYAQVWALARFLEEGAGGKYRGALEQLLLDAADGRLVARISESRHVRLYKGRDVVSQVRNGPAALKAYFNPNLDAITAEYEDFIRRLASTHRPAPLVEEDVAAGAMR